MNSEQLDPLDFQDQVDVDGDTPEPSSILETFRLKPMLALWLADSVCSILCWISVFIIGISILAITTDWLPFTDTILPVLSIFICTTTIVIRLVLGWIAYKRTQYIFTRQGLTIEGGLIFFSDFIGWQHLNDVNLSRSIFQQLIGHDCGTIELRSVRQYPKQLLYVPNSRGIYLFFQQCIAKNLQSSRNINSL